jgi:adenylate cyclase
MPKGVSRPIMIYEVGGIGGEYGLYLPPQENSPMARLPKPHPVRFSAHDGMSSGVKSAEGLLK